MTNLHILALAPGDPHWAAVADFADQCSWRAGKALAEQMRTSAFQDWERVFAALENDCPAGYCTFCRMDCLPDVPYTPYIGFVFVDEAWRGHRLSQRLIDAASQYARKQGFDRVYLVSDHKGLYEKYGFAPVDARPAPWDPDEVETVFVRELNDLS